MCLKLVLLASAFFILSYTPTTLGETENTSNAANQCTNIPDGERIDCYPIGNANQEKCTQRKCCWGPSKIPGIPYCYYPTGSSGYSSDAPVKTPTGFTVEMKRKFPSLFPKDVQTVKMDFRLETPTRLHVKITDAKQTRYETPFPKVPEFNGPESPTQEYDIQVKKGSSGFNVIRKKTQQPIFSALDVGDLVYADQFLEISGILPNGTSIYGLGQHQGPLKINSNREWKLLSLFNHDDAPSDNKPLYGSHPFYLAVEPSGKSHGVYLHNSNAMDVAISTHPIITFRTIGGILDLYFFLGPTPGDVIRQYGEVIGKPILPPYWALGYHLCRYDYKTKNRTEQIWNQTRNAGIPYDTQWNDIDYMDDFKDFSYDKKRYAGLPEFVKKVHEAGMHYIPIIDPGISGDEPIGKYPPFDEGVKRDIFIKDHQGKLFKGKVWNPVSTVFPDFTNPKTAAYWSEMLKSFYDQVQFDGIWIDMNDPSNRYHGTKDGCPKHSLERPPYTPHVNGGLLSHLTLCMTAKQHAGTHYDTHNLYGTTEATQTHSALIEIVKKRPFIISRSSFAGHGKYAGIWTGDIFSRWYDMKISIPQVLNFNMFQIPMAGADICGFIGDTTVPLCQRWHQLGAFYPFARNHNNDNNRDQDPVSLGPAVVEVAKSALFLRYRLLPYLYTLFFNANTKGDTVARPLFFEFPEDKNTHSQDEQFLWGSWLLIVPVLKEKVTEVTFYLPKGIWYSFNGTRTFNSTGAEITLQAPISEIPLLVRGGGILPQQEPATTTTEARRNPFYLTVAPNDQNKAEGELYWDDGDSLGTVEEGRYTLVKFSLERNVLKGNPVTAKVDLPSLKRIAVYGVAKKPDQVKINGTPTSDYKYDANTRVLQILGNINLKTSFTVEW